MKIRKKAQSAGLVATVVNSLNSNSKTDALAAEQGKVLNEKIEGTVLYEDERGTSGTVTLTDSAENYKYIEIFYRRGTTEEHYSEKVYSPNGKKVGLIGAFHVNNFDSNGDLFQIRARIVLINGTSITTECDGYINLQKTGVHYMEDEKNGYIYRVVGYK